MGQVIYQKRIMRDDLKNNPKVMYLFGDNMTRKGLGGQAKEMRYEPNAVGVATKNTCGEGTDDYFSDDQIDIVKGIFETDLSPAVRHLKDGGTLIVPADGLGTGLSELPTRAPKCNALLVSMLKNLESI